MRRAEPSPAPEGPRIHGRAVHPGHRCRGRPRPPALGRRPAAPHGAPLSRQAGRRRRGTARHLRRVRHRGQPRRARARRPRTGQGRPAGTAVAQLLAVRRAHLRRRQARRGAGAGELHAERRGDRLHPPALRIRRHRRGGRPRPDRREGRRLRGTVRRGTRLDRAVRRGPGRRLGGRGRLVAAGSGRRPRRADRGRRPAAADVHLGHRVAAQGRAAAQPLADQPVPVLRHRRRDDGRGHRGARAADVPLRPTRRVLLRRRLPRRDQHHPARTGPGHPAGDHRARAGHQAVLPAHGVDLAAAPPGLRHHRPVQPAQGLLRRLADAGGGAARTAAAPAGRAAVELLRPDRDVTARHHTGPRRAAVPGRKRRARRGQRRDDAGRRRRQPGAAGHRRRDRAPQPARRARLLQRRGEDGGGV